MASSNMMVKHSKKLYDTCLSLCGRTVQVASNLCASGDEVGVHDRSQPRVMGAGLRSHYHVISLAKRYTSVSSVEARRYRVSKTPKSNGLHGSMNFV